MDVREWQEVFRGSNAACEKFLDDQNLSKKPFTRRSNTSYFRCKNMKKYSCSVRFRLTLTTGDGKVERSDEHEHNETTAKRGGVPGLSAEIKGTLLKAMADELLPSVRNRQLDDILEAEGQTKTVKMRKSKLGQLGRLFCQHSTVKKKDSSAACSAPVPSA